MPSPFSLADEFKQPALEEAFLAAVARSPALYWETVGRISAQAFTDGRDVTYRALAEAIEADQAPPEVPGEPAEDPAAAAATLADLYQRRRLADFAQNVLAELRGKRPSPDLIVEFEKDLAQVEIAFKEAEAGRMTTVEAVFTEVLEEVRALHKQREESGTTLLGVPTGFKRLDEELGGLQPGLHLVAAEPGLGKTTMVLGIGAHAAANGIPTIFVSFEETLKRLTLKVVCAKAKLNAKNYAEGYGDPRTLETAFREHQRSLSQLHFIAGGSTTTVAQVRAKALQAMAKARAAGLRPQGAPDRCLVIIDYLQTWASSRKEFTDFRHVVNALVAELREMALKHLNSPVLVISSQNRGGQNTSRLTSLKESGDLEYATDSAWFLVSNESRFATPPSRPVDLVLAKNRYGDKDQTIPLLFKPDVGTFQEAEGWRG